MNRKKADPIQTTPAFGHPSLQKGGDRIKPGETSPPLIKGRCPDIIVRTEGLVKNKKPK